MLDTVNPYIPGQPVSNPDLFFGRRDLLASIREHLLKDRRVFLLSGAQRMGKTSLLRRMPHYLPDDAVAVYVELGEEQAQRLDWLLWRVADALWHQLPRSQDLALPESAWSDFEGHTDRLLDEYWPQVRAALGDRLVILMFDDLDSLAAGEGRLLEAFLAALAVWRERDDGLAFLLTSPAHLETDLLRQHGALFGGASTHTLGPLSSEEATRLITWPVAGVITYDYGVARRLIEITSGHPYFLQLLCFEVFNRCAASGWVNQRDVDLVVEDLVEREIPDFRQVWDESSPQEQAVLAGLVSLRGARGIATVQEVRTILTKAGARPDRGQIAHVLDSLVARGILQQLGALSYRFCVALLRDWLEERIDLPAVVRDTRWDAAGRKKAGGGQRVSKLLTRKERRARGKTPARAAAAPAEATEKEAPGEPTLPRFWMALGAIFGVTLLVGAAFFLFRSDAPLATPTATQRPSPTAGLATATRTPQQSQATDLPVAAASPTRTSPPTFTVTPSPTPPLIVSRTLPALAYQARGAGEAHWSIYVMNSDGSNRTRLTDGQFEAFSPVWSPDGARIAFGSDRDGGLDIWVMDRDGGNPVNLTQHEAKDRWPAWSPAPPGSGTGGQWIAFASVRDAAYWELYVMRADGSDVQRLTWWEDASDWSPSWSPDGTRLAFASYRDGNWEIYTMDRDGSNLLRLTDDPADDTNPAWSPDGGRIAFESTRGEGYTDLYVMALGGGEPVNLTNSSWSTDLGPSWSPDGGRIAFYSDRDGEWDVYVMGSDGSDVVKLTGDSSVDQVPAWRP